MANRPITDAELDELIALSDGPHVLHWGLLNRALRELRDSRWTPITPENLPTMDDEVVRWRKDILGDFRQVLSVVDLFEWACTDYAVWTAAGWTHFRKINFPKDAA